jgi:DNA-binding transcriptional MerR regulator
MDTLTIGAVARRSGVTPEAIRYWERQGVLEAVPRDDSGRRQYPQRILEELRMLKAAQSVGFSLEQIARLLALTRTERVPCREMSGLAARQLGELDARIDALHEARDRLASALDACECSDTCAVPARLAALGATAGSVPGTVAAAR